LPPNAKARTPANSWKLWCWKPATKESVSVITVLELAHGITRADTPERRERRQRFLDELLIGVPIQPVTVPIALRAGQIDGQSQAKGVRIPLSDLLIGASALELG
jgi:predicted nucleic acid-binding protein